MPWPAPALLHHSLPEGEALQGDLLSYQRVGLCREAGLDAGRKEPGVWGEREFAGQVQTVRALVFALRASAQLRADSFLTPVPLGGLTKGPRPCGRGTRGPGPRPRLFAASRGEPSFPVSAAPSGSLLPAMPTTLTFSRQVELSKLAEDTLGGEVHVAGGQAGVVAQVRGIGPGDVQVPRGLGHEVTPVRRDEVGELVEEPAVGQAYIGRGGFEETAGRWADRAAVGGAVGVPSACWRGSLDLVLRAPCSELALRGDSERRRNFTPALGVLPV